MSKLHFIYNNINSLDLGISIKSMRRGTLADKRIEKLTLPGYHGTLYQDDEIYETYPLDLECTIKKSFDLSSIRKLKELFKSRVGELILSVNPESIHQVRIVSTIDFNKFISQSAGTFLLSFEVHPFAYLKSGREWIALSNNKILENLGNFYSEPVFKITGTGSCYLSINNKKMNFKNVNKPFYLDVRLEDLYGENKENLNSFMDIESDFVGFQEGDNKITISGISKIEVQPNWREL